MCPIEALPNWRHAPRLYISCGPILGRAIYLPCGEARKSPELEREVEMNIPWRVKSATFKLVDLFNAPRFLYFLQRHVTKRSRITQLGISDDWVRHGNTINKYKASCRVFEFGAGKNLAQNLYLSDIIGTQIVVDLNPMIDLDLVNTARRLLSEKCQLRSNEEIDSIKDLTYYGIDYRAPYDASDTDFEDSSIDSCISTNTLEHIPRESILEIFDELHRILKPGGIISAKIDYSDHYAHTDPSISLLNFLKFSETEWKLFNHNCHYQNRMRHYDFIQIFDKLGFKIVEEEATYDENKIPQEIADRFDTQPDTWAATSGYFVLMKDPIHHPFLKR
ncbi:class I SAM-dependent methyltransferase [Haliea sp. E1-2-M8]|uniref:class I SAM-dependent methyltransferase n=1 Tax=Haliea sp. E1-2-M8 TaxID=3064706 RepID=UPI0027200670|nr:class I SAM-dependent methyltransferase [Haliea sp. E1-2-M8]MDO8860412.1 class I SAM-dependent methyltransferase [Haliea sp. E1-2-M8]